MQVVSYAILKSRLNGDIDRSRCERAAQHRPRESETEGQRDRGTERAKESQRVRGTERARDRETEGGREGGKKRDR